VNKGTIGPLPAKDEFFNGKVIRPLRSVNPDQDEYCGLIQTKTEEGIGKNLKLIASFILLFLSFLQT
jgi:hypothetical protein